MGHLAGELDDLWLAGELIGVVQGEAGDGEEEDDGEGRHRQVDVQPAGDDGRASPELCSPGGLRRDVASACELVDERIAVYGAWVSQR